jgi:hypothetical protein
MNATAELAPEDPRYDFEGLCFDLEKPKDREIICFMLSQALYGEATGVYCGKSLYTARSLEAARFYIKQARQEINHLELFAEIFRVLEMQPTEAHWTIRLLSSHNNYYPLKVLMEHAIGEGMVLDIFRDVMLQTLPDSDPRVPGIKKKLRAVCREEQEHVAWGEKETRAMLELHPWLRTPYAGLIELQLSLIPVVIRRFEKQMDSHPVLGHLPAFAQHVRDRVRQQGRDLGILDEEPMGRLRRWWSMSCGALLYVRSRLARSRSKLEKIYLSELGFEG